MSHFLVDYQWVLLERKTTIPSARLCKVKKELSLRIEISHFCLISVVFTVSILNAVSGSCSHLASLTFKSYLFTILIKFSNLTLLPQGKGNFTAEFEKCVLLSEVNPLSITMQTDQFSQKRQDWRVKNYLGQMSIPNSYLLLKADGWVLHRIFTL